MIATIWGCRGSLATPGAATLEYGGNTSCVELELDDRTTVLLDAGTGIRELGLRLANRPPTPIHLLLTHLHLDHLAGLPFFAPLWDPRARIHIYAPASPFESVENAIARYVSPPLFPVSISEVPAQVTFHDLPEEAWRLGSARVLAEPVRHRGPTVGYRLEEAGRSLAHIPDHEPYSNAEPDAVEPELVSGYRLAREASVLIHDAQYAEEEYATRIGWGIQASPTPSPSPAPRTLANWCSSTTIRSIQTRTSARSRRVPPSSGQAGPNRPSSRAKGCA